MTGFVCTITTFIGCFVWGMLTGVIAMGLAFIVFFWIIMKREGKKQPKDGKEDHPYGI